MDSEQVDEARAALVSIIPVSSAWGEAARMGVGAIDALCAQLRKVEHALDNLAGTIATRRDCIRCPVDQGRDCGAETVGACIYAIASWAKATVPEGE